MRTYFKKEKTVKENLCGFDLAWQPKCKSPKQPKKKFCKEHLKLKCDICGKQATHECGYSLSLVCGAPLCDNKQCVEKEHNKRHLPQRN